MELSACPTGSAHGPSPEVTSPQGVIAYALPEDLRVFNRHWHPSKRQDFRDFLDEGVMGNVFLIVLDGVQGETRWGGGIPRAQPHS